MFLCYKCREVVGPCVPPVITPKGFYVDEKGNKTGDRLGEVLLCPRCAKAFDSCKDDIVQALGGFEYNFLLTR